MRSILPTAALALSAALAGCVTQPPKPPRPSAVVNTETPRCTGARPCEAMWLDAQEVLQSVTGMQLRLVTDSRLETLAPTKTAVGSVVTKYPVGADANEMRVEIFCRRAITDCSDLSTGETKVLNNLMAARAGARAERP